MKEIVKIIYQRNWETTLKIETACKKQLYNFIAIKTYLINKIMKADELKQHASIRMLPIIYSGSYNQVSPLKKLM